MYKAGYDPSALLSFFEKLQAKEKSKPGTISWLFSDHPPTGARTAAIKHEIETILPAREQYAVSSSEFDTVKARLASVENRSASTNQRPTYRRRSPNGRQPSPNPGPTTTDDTSTTQPKTQPDSEATDDDRPTLKRKN